MTDVLQGNDCAAFEGGDVTNFSSKVKVQNAKAPTLAGERFCVSEAT
jgi:hypothetical protein